MANVVVNFANTDKAAPASLRENLEKRNISYEEKKEGNMTVIFIKATEPRNASKSTRDAR